MARWERRDLSRKATASVSLDSLRVQVVNRDWGGRGGDAHGHLRAERSLLHNIDGHGDVRIMVSIESRVANCKYNTLLLNWMIVGNRLVTYSNINLKVPWNDSQTLITIPFVTYFITTIFWKSFIIEVRAAWEGCMCPFENGTEILPIQPAEFRFL